MRRRNHAKIENAESCYRERVWHSRAAIVSDWHKRYHGTGNSWPDGGIGRRTGLKIPWGVTPVRVRAPLRPLSHCVASSRMPTRKSATLKWIRPLPASSSSMSSPVGSSHAVASLRNVSRPDCCKMRCASPRPSVPVACTAVGSRTV